MPVIILGLHFRLSSYIVADLYNEAEVVLHTLEHGMTKGVQGCVEFWTCTREGVGGVTQNDRRQTFLSVVAFW